MDKNFLGLVGLAAIAPLLFAFAPLDHTTTVTTVNSQNAEVAGKTTQQIGQMSLQINNALATQSSALANAIRGAVAQEAIGATQIATADRNAKVVAAEAQHAIDISQKTIDVKLKYGSETGQGYAACKVYAANRQLDGGINQAILDINNKVNSTDNSPGNFISSEDEYAKERQSTHAANFCTDAEKAANRCSEVSDQPGLDSNAAVLFSSAEPGSKTGLAKQLVRENILGKPDIAIPANQGQTAQGQAYLYESNRQTALKAFPAYSLAYLESMSEKRENLKGSDGQPQSPNDLLFNTVSRYYGSDEAKEWNKSMVKQMPRGLLVELAKIEGLGAYLDNQEFKSNMRIEGNIAAMTITSALPMEEDLARQRNTMARANTAAAIKNSR